MLDEGEEEVVGEGVKVEGVEEVLERVGEFGA